MKKIINLSLITVLLVSTSYHCLKAQHLEGFVKYTRLLNLDTIHNIKDTIGSPSFLYFTAAKSLYVYDRTKDTKVMETDLERLEKAVKSGNFVITVGPDTDEYGNMFYKNLLTNKLIMRELVYKKGFIAEETLPVINWNILNEKRKISNFNCQKAITRFRGRDYEAWFTTAIPVSSGPWKLHGLPGLILEAYDTQRKIQYLFESVTIPFDTKADLIEPKNGKKIKFNDFKNIQRTEGEKVDKFLKSTQEKGSDVEIESHYYKIETTYE